MSTDLSKEIDPNSPISSEKTTVSRAIDPNHLLLVADFIKGITFPDSSLDDFTSHDDFSVLLQSNIKAISVERGRISCSVFVSPPLTNFFNGLHGGAIASISERLSLACAKTVVSEDKPLFVGELSMSYLSAAPVLSEVFVEGTVVRSGKNMTMVNVEFKMKENMKITYLARATIYHSLLSKI